MEQIRTLTGKLFGTYDRSTCTLYIKDGARTRAITVRPGGLQLAFMSENGKTETLNIPLQTSTLHT